MSKQKLLTFFLYLLMLTLGAAGIVTAFNGGASFTKQTDDETKSVVDEPPSPADSKTVEEILDYNWHESGPFRTLQTQDGDEVIIDRLHVYFKTEDDLFRGKITALAGVMDHVGRDDQPLNVQFIQNNAVVAATTLKADGTFEIAGLLPGPYDLRVLSKNSLLVSSFVLSTRGDLENAGYNEEDIDRVYRAQEMRPFELEAAGCIPSDYDAVVKLLSENYEFSKQASPPPEFPEWTRLHIPKETFFDAAEGGTSMLRHTVRQDRDGVLHGQLRKPIDLPTEQVGVKQIGDIELFFLQDGNIVKRIFSDEDGKFDVPGLIPGNYSVVARSPYAVGVIGVRVIAFENAAAGLNAFPNGEPFEKELPSAPANESVGIADPQSSVPMEHYTTMVSSLLQPDGAPNLSLDMSLATPFELPGEGEDEEEPPTAFAGGGGGGGAGGGGGFFFPPFWWEDSSVSPVAPGVAPGPPGPQGPQGPPGLPGQPGGP